MDGWLVGMDWLAKIYRWKRGGEETSDIETVIIWLILIYLGRGYLINLVHGMFFRFKGDILIGQKIKIDNHNGEVKVLKTFDLLLENKDGESVIIPYSSLAKQELILQNHSSEFFTHAFSLFTENNLNMELLENEIKKSPWISSVVKSKITKSQSENNQTKYNVIVYSLNEKYNYFIENDLRSFVKDSKLNTNK